MPNPRVFISYSHESNSHRDAVLALSEKLRADGVETVLDRYINGSPPEGWPRWMLNELDRATHVICVCTETYYRRFRGHEEPGVGRGVDWEGACITLDLYNARSRNTKFIPAIVDERGQSYIPEPLRGASFYRIGPDYEGLYDAILGQAGVEPAPLGELRIKARTGAQVSDSPAHHAPPKKPRPEPTPEELAAVFAETVAAIESVLNSAPNAAKFLGPQAPASGRFVMQQSGQWVVLPAYRENDADVSPVLRAIWDRKSSFSAPRHEWDALEQIVGGVLVLGMNRKWVWEQRQIFANSAVEHPKYADSVAVETGKAQFLAVIATALANGCARLDRVFGPLDRKRVLDINTALLGTTAASRSAEIKRHFIRYVLTPSDDLDVDSLTDEDEALLTTSFDRVRQLLLLANRVDRDPFVAAGPRLTTLAKEVKQHLELSDLYLFVPAASGDESQLMTNPVLALSLAQRIRAFIHRERPNI
jgi:hypothetical protein